MSQLNEFQSGVNGKGGKMTIFILKKFVGFNESETNRIYFFFKTRQRENKEITAFNKVPLFKKKKSDCPSADALLLPG